MNKSLKVLDLSYNSFSGKAVSQEFTAVFETNRTLEYVGVAKNNLETADIIPMIKSFGRFPFPTDQVVAYQAKLKERDATIEKNKKLKASKKPEEPVPVMDLIESKNNKDQDGNDTVNWFMLKNPQFRHLNLCLNSIEDSAQEEIEAALRITPDDFCFTLSGNAFSEEVVAAIQKTVQYVHKQRITEQRLSDPGT